MEHVSDRAKASVKGGGPLVPLQVLPKKYTLRP